MTPFIRTGRIACVATVSQEERLDLDGGWRQHVPPCLPAMSDPLVFNPRQSWNGREICGRPEWNHALKADEIEELIASLPDFDVTATHKPHVGMGDRWKRQRPRIFLSGRCGLESGGFSLNWKKAPASSGFGVTNPSASVTSCGFGFRLPTIVLSIRCFWTIMAQSTPASCGAACSVVSPRDDERHRSWILSGG